MERPEGECFAYLQELKMPVLVVSGSADIVVPIPNAYLLQQHLPDAQLVIYPDTSHDSLYQYRELFMAHATLFLNN